MTDLTEIRNTLIGFGIINTLIGIAATGFILLFGKILIALGIGCFCSFIIIWVYQQPTTPSNKSSKDAIHK